MVGLRRKVNRVVEEDLVAGPQRRHGVEVALAEAHHHRAAYDACDIELMAARVPAADHHGCALQVAARQILQPQCGREAHAALRLSSRH
jgi:hypothetical protein